jgi:tetratricopeptide (TPR) repeat protein
VVACHPTLALCGGIPVPDRPSRIGPFLLLHELGRGSSGVVYAARHAESGEAAALKTLFLPRASLLRRIQREIHVLKRLEHPGVLWILGEGVHAGVPWYAMELIRGATLRSHGRTIWDPQAEPPPRPRIDRERLAELLCVVRRLCSTLAYLHGEGVVHRDLKPENVLVRDSGHPVVLDFGLVEHSGSGAGREKLDAPGLTAGTVLYMAPEQIRGEVCDARADIYALGCILFEVLTGMPPFPGPSARHVLTGHLQRTPPRASDRVDGIPAELDELLLRCLEKEPRDRPGHASDLEAVLEACGAENDWSGLGQRPFLYRPGLAGRDEALQRLCSLVLSGEPSRGGLVLIGGPSGMGKTRLASEIARQARRRGMAVFVGRCSMPTSADRSRWPESGVSLEAFREPLCELAEVCREKGEAETLRVFGARGPVLARYEPTLASLPGLERFPPPAELSDQAERLRLLRCLLETFGAAAEGPGLLLILDDLQWADERTLEVLDSCSRRPELAEAGLWLLGTFRSDEAPPGLSLLLQRQGLEHVELAPLADPAVQRIVQESLAACGVPDAVMGAMSRHAEGNPLFVVEYLFAAVCEGILRRGPAGAWSLSSAATEARGPGHGELFRLPLSIRELLWRRFERMSPAAQRLARTLAVLGKEAEGTVLERAAALRQAELFTAVEELRSNRLVEDAGDDRLRFVHGQIHEALLDALTVPQRRELHRAAAEALEAAVPDEAVPLAALAHQWEQAGERERARDRFLAAARRAVRQTILDEAGSAYARFLALAEPGAERAEARRELAERVLMVQGRYRQAAEEATLAASEALEIPDRREWLRCLVLLGRIQGVLGQMREASRALQEALQAPEAARDRNLRVAALLAMAGLLRKQGRLLEAEALLQEARGQIAVLDEPRLQTAVVEAWASVLIDQARFGEARSALLHVLELARQRGDRLREAVVLGSLAICDASEGHALSARGLYHQALAIHREIGNRPSEAITLMNLAVGALEEGDMAAAIGLCEAALRIHVEAGNQAHEGTTLSNLAFARWALGRVEEAEAMALQALELQRRIGDELGEAVTEAHAALIDVDLGRIETGLERLSRAVRLQRRLPDPLGEAGSLCFRARLLRQLGRPETAAGDLARAEAILGGHRNPFLEGCCACERGHLALSRGDDPAAWLARAEENASLAHAGPGSLLGRGIRRLRDAWVAGLAGEELRRGELPGTLPEELRRSLAAHSQVRG